MCFTVKQAKWQTYENTYNLVKDRVVDESSILQRLTSKSKHVRSSCRAELIVYVMTVGADRPVNFSILESFRATSTWNDTCSKSAQKLISERWWFSYSRMRTKLSYNRSKRLLRISASFWRILLILLNVETDGCTFGASPRETKNLQMFPEMGKKIKKKNNFSLVLTIHSKFHQMWNINSTYQSWPIIK